MGFTCEEDDCSPTFNSRDSGDNGDGGAIDITLNQGATIGGANGISVESGYATLTFALDVFNANDYDNAVSIIDTDAASGSFTLDGREYKWSGINDLVDQLNFLGVRVTASDIAEALRGSGSATSMQKSNTFRCDTRNITAFVNERGTITFTSKLPPALSQRILVGDLSGAAFTSQNPVGITVVVVVDGKRTSANVVAADGTVLGTCRLSGSM